MKQIFIVGISKGNLLITALLLFCVFGIYIPQITAQTNGQTRGANAMVSTNDEIKGTTRALIVGISDYYSETLKLKYADNDAVLFYLFLLNNEYINIKQKNIKLLLNKDATVDNITSELEWLKDNASPNDETIIYFAGHADVVKVVDGEAGFFLTHYASDQREYRAGGAIPFSYFEYTTDTIATKGSKVWFITDACRSGSIINEKGAELSLTALNANFNKTLKIVSSKPNQFSYEYDEIKHGVFTYYLVQALMGKADSDPSDMGMTADEVRDFIRKRVKTYTGKKQSPSLYTDDDDEILALPNQVFLKITSDNIDMMKAVYSEKVAGLFTIDMAFNSNDMTIDEVKLVDDFAVALQERNFFENDTSAHYLYMKSIEQDFDSIIQNVLKNNLINTLNSESQKTINKYLGSMGKSTKNKILSYSDASKAITICLDLVSNSNFNYNTILARKLFFDAYMIILKKDYKQYSVAEKKLLSSLSILPNASYTHNSLGELYQYWHNYPKAEYHLNKTIEDLPTWAKPHNDLGNVYQSQGNYKAALIEFEKALNLDTSFIIPYNNIGNIYLETGQYSKAENAYRIRIEDDSMAVVTLMNLGVLYNLRGQADVAEQYYRKVIEMDSTYELGYLKLGKHLINNYKKEEGLWQLEKAVELAPDDPQCIYELANYYSYNSSDTNSRKYAVDLFRKTIETDPYYIWAYISMAWYYTNSRNYTDAENYFQLAIDSLPYRAVPYHQMARFKSDQKQYDSAITYYEKGIGIDPYHYASYESYSRFMEVTIGDNNEAENILLKASSIFDNSPLVAKDMADFYYRVGDTSEAIKYYEKAKVIDSSFAYSYSSLALIYLNKNNFDEALKNYTKAAKFMPYKLSVGDFLKNIQNKSIGLMKTNKEDAIIGFNTILSVEKNNLISLKNLSMLYYLQGKPKEALPYIEICLEQSYLSYNQEKSYLKLKALIMFDLKKYDEALEIFNEIIKKSPMPSYLEKAVVLLTMKENEKATSLYNNEKALPYSSLNIGVKVDKYSDNFNKRLNKLIKLSENE